MNYRKRAGLYLLRKKGKTLSIFLLVFIVSALLLSCAAILSASERLAEDIRSLAGAAFYLRGTTETAVDKNGDTMVSQNKIRVTESDIEEILRCGEIAYYNPLNYGYAKSAQLYFIPGEKHSDESNMGQMTAAKYTALIQDFADEKLVLSKGRHIAGTDSKVILISALLAEANRLTVGDKVVLESAQLGEREGEYTDIFSGARGETEVTVAGIYDIKAMDMPLTATAGKQENHIYASLDVLENLNEAEASVYTGEVDFYLNDPDDLDAVVSKIQTDVAIDWDTHFIRTNDFQYSQLAEELYSLGNLAKILFVCVSAAGTAILLLMFILRIRGRMHEAGILLACGISKREIVKQFLFEILAVSAGAFLISYVLYYAVSLMSGQFLSGDTVLREVQAELISASDLQRIGSGSGKAADYLSLSAKSILAIYGGQTAVISAAVMIAAASVLRMKPKEILTKIN